MHYLLLVTTLFIAPAGNIAPDTEVVVVDDMMKCAELAGKVHRDARADGQMVFANCQPARPLDYYLKHDYKGRPYQ